VSTAPAALDQRILDALTESADTLADLSTRLRADPADVLRTLQQLGSLKRVACRREDGALLWDLAEAVTALEPKALPVPATCATAPAVAPVVRAKPRRRPNRARDTSGITDRLRAMVRAEPWLVAGDLLTRLPDAKPYVIYALLSQRVQAGEFIAHPPMGRFRRYAVTGTPIPATVAKLPAKRVRAERSHPQIHGVTTAFELCLRFVVWANGLDGEPAAELIAKEFGVSLVTAYRWRGAWHAAREALAA
jgi:hypothetical protein